MTADILDRRSYLLPHRTTELSPREREVLRLTALGLSQKEIAFQLGIHVQTIKNHVTAAWERLDVHSAADAFRALGWLVVPDE